MPKSRLRLGERAAIGACAAAWLLQWLRTWQASGEPAWSGIFPPVALALLVIFRSPAIAAGPAPRWTPAAGAAALLGVLAVRPWLEPFPGWPLAEWTFSAGLFVVILAVVAAAEGKGAAAPWVRPMLFGLAALPWPAFLTAGFMGKVRTWTAQGLAEAFTWAGRPALANGTALRVGRGTIGIEEACGGIRSLQTAVLLALAIGALRRDGPGRQTRLLAGGVGLALAANALRLAGLAWICGVGGNAAVERWHDRMAALEFGVVLLGFGALALRPSPVAAGLPKRSSDCPTALAVKGSAALAAAVLALLVLGEASVQWWFWRAGRGAAGAFDWSVRLPANFASYSAQPWTPAMQSLLRCDAHQIGAWSDADGRRREGYAVEWRENPSAAGALAEHNPDVCLPLAGNTRIGGRAPVAVEWGGRRRFFSVAAFSGPLGRFELYYLTVKADGAAPAYSPTNDGDAVPVGLASRWREVLAGRRGLSARAIAVAIFDAAGPDDADRQFRAEISRIILPPGGP